MQQKSQHKNEQNQKTPFSRLALAFGCFCMLCSLAPAAMAQNAFRGESLYWNHCGSCHDKSVHTRKDRRAKSVEEVYIWVVAWTVHNGIHWRVEDVEDVTLYLSRYLYEFDR